MIKRNWDNGKENGSYRGYRDYIGIIGYTLGDIGILANEMETTIKGLGFRV